MNSQIQVARLQAEYLDTFDFDAHEVSVSRWINITSTIGIVRTTSTHRTVSTIDSLARYQHAA